MVVKPRLRLHLWVALVVLALGAALLATPVTAQAPTRGAWTVMVYLISDNQTEGAAVGSCGIIPPTNDLPSIVNLMEMSALSMYDTDGVSQPPVRAVVQLDRAAGIGAADDSTNSNWTTAHRFRVIHDDGTGNTFTEIFSDPATGFPLTDLGELNMASPYNLVDFVSWAAARYPADHYALFLWDYTGDWMTQPYKRSPVRWFGDDSGAHFDVADLNYALSAIQGVLGKKLEVLALDSEAMGTVEAIHCLSDNVQYIVAAEAGLGAVSVGTDGKAYGIQGGYDYQWILDDVVAAPNMLAQEFANNVAASSGWAALPLDAGQMPTLVSSLSTFATELVNTFRADPGGPLASMIHTYWEMSAYWADPRGGSDVPFGSVDYIDLGCFAELVAGSAPTTALRDAALDVASKVKRVTGEYWWDPIATIQGLAIMHPFNVMPPQEYRWTWLANDTTWDDWIFTQPIGWGYYRDQFEPDGSLEEATPIEMPYSQGWHWFDRTDDMDAASFQATAGVLYAVWVSWVGPYSTPYMAIVDADNRVLTTADFPETLLLWTCPRDGAYYVVTSQSDTYDQPHRTGGWTYYCVTAVPVRFYDVAPSHWAFHHIAACEKEGLVGGYASGYRPNLAVTRDQMAVYIARALCGGDANVPNGPRQPSFVDVPTDHWAYKYVEYAKAQGIVSGYSGGRYRPNLNVTRGQMAVFVARALAGGDAAIPSEFTGRPFRDVPKDHWAWKYIKYVAEAGIVGGYGDRTYRSETTCTRDQMAVFMARAFLPPLQASPFASGR